MESDKKYIMRILGAENTAKPKGTKIIVKPAIQSRVKSLTELAANQLERSIKRQAKLPEPGTSNRVKSLKHLAANAMVEDKARESKSVLTFSNRPVSLAEMRHDELDKITASHFSPDSSFQNLFDERLRHMPGKQGNVQITINTDVENIIGNKSTITPKRYGPFKVSVQK